MSTHEDNGRTQNTRTLHVVVRVGGCSSEVRGQNIVNTSHHLQPVLHVLFICTIKCCFLHTLHFLPGYNGVYLFHLLLVSSTHFSSTPAIVCQYLYVSHCQYFYSAMAQYTTNLALFLGLPTIYKHWMVGRAEVRG